MLVHQAFRQGKEGVLEAKKFFQNHLSRWCESRGEILGVHSHGTPCRDHCRGDRSKNHHTAETRCVLPYLSGLERASPSHSFKPLSFSVFSATLADLPPMIHPSPASECSPLDCPKPHPSLAAISSSRTLPINIESFRPGRKTFLRFTSSPGKMSTSKGGRSLMLPGQAFMRKALVTNGLTVIPHPASRTVSRLSLLQVAGVHNPPASHLYIHPVLGYGAVCFVFVSCFGHALQAVVRRWPCVQSQCHTTFPLYGLQKHFLYCWQPRPTLIRQTLER